MLTEHPEFFPAQLLDKPSSPRPKAAGSRNGRGLISWGCTPYVFVTKNLARTDPRRAAQTGDRDQPRRLPSTCCKDEVGLLRPGAASCPISLPASLRSTHRCAPPAYREPQFNGDSFRLGRSKHCSRAGDQLTTPNADQRTQKAARGVFLRSLLTYLLLRSTDVLFLLCSQVTCDARNSEVITVTLQILRRLRARRFCQLFAMRSLQTGQRKRVTRQMWRRARRRRVGG
jgi:hypothetical protein